MSYPIYKYRIFRIIFFSVDIAWIVPCKISGITFSTPIFIIIEVMYEIGIINQNNHFFQGKNFVSLKTSIRSTLTLHLWHFCSNYWRKRKPCTVRLNCIAYAYFLYVSRDTRASLRSRKTRNCAGYPVWQCTNLIPRSVVSAIGRLPRKYSHSSRWSHADRH